MKTKIKTAEEILEPYVETPFRHTKIVEKDNAILAMNKFGDQFKGLPQLNIEEHPTEADEFGGMEGYFVAELVGVQGMVAHGNTKEEAVDELMTTIKVKLLYDFNSSR